MMKKLLIINLLLLFINQSNKAQWIKQISGVTSNLLSVYFVDSLNGWAVGDDGVILRYKDSIWSVQASNVKVSLKSVFFIDTLNGWACGANGTILKYDGTNWTKQNSGTTKTLNSVFFITKTFGMIAGGDSEDGTDGFILRYSSQKWGQESIEQCPKLTSLQLTDTTNGWACGGKGTLLRFINDSWMAYSPILSDHTLSSLYMINSNNGWTVGIWGDVMHYNGYKWISVDVPKSAMFYKVQFADVNHGWILGSPGYVLLYDGKSWIINGMSNITEEPLFSMHFADTLRGWAVGFKGNIYKTSNGGIVNIDKNADINRDIKIYYDNFSKNLKVQSQNWQPQSLSVYDITGKQVAVFNVLPLQNNYNLRFLKAGIYFYNLSFKNNSVKGKFIIAD